jgi:hypothetical protein
MDKEAFDRRLEFDEGGASWVDGIILEALECLRSNKLSAPGSDCDFCKYRKAVKEAVRQFEKLIYKAFEPICLP